jgi:sporulation protein YlmC with PRC-barrel domain
VSAKREVRLERLLGRLLVDATGVPVGRIEDVEAYPDGEDYLVTHVVVVPEGRLAGLLAAMHRLPTLRALGLGRKPRTRRVPWTWLDLSDPSHPRLLPNVAEDETSARSA